MKHKWHDEIVAWAGGAEIEFLSKQTCTWEIATQPSWETYVQYRIKPQPKKPIKLFVIEYIDNKSVRLSTDGFYTTKLEKIIGKIEVLDD